MATTITILATCKENYGGDITSIKNLNCHYQGVASTSALGLLLKPATNQHSNRVISVCNGNILPLIELSLWLVVVCDYYILPLIELSLWLVVVCDYYILPLIELSLWGSDVFWVIFGGFQPTSQT
jgi:hypothetical protein